MKAKLHYMHTHIRVCYTKKKRWTERPFSVVSTYSRINISFKLNSS